MKVTKRTTPRPPAAMVEPKYIPFDDRPWEGVLFVWTSFTGMVGEACSEVSAHRIRFDCGGGIRFRRRVEYEWLKANYRRVKGKNGRKLYWKALQEMSPEGRAAELERQTADAICRVI